MFSQSASTTNNTPTSQADSGTSNSQHANSKPRKKQWRTLKQITAAEQLLPWPSSEENDGKV